MPLVMTIEEPNMHIGIWSIDESADFFLSNLSPCVLADIDQPMFGKNKSDRKVLEYLCSRYLLQTIIGREQICLFRKTKEGQPYLENDNRKISLSHSSTHAAVIVSPLICGIDIEAVTERVKKVANRFLHSDEWQITGYSDDNTRILTLLWSAKETLYKLHALKGLDFRSGIRLSNLQLADDGTGWLDGRIINKGRDLFVKVYFRFLSDHVLTYAVLTTGTDSGSD